MLALGCALVITFAAFVVIAKIGDTPVERDLTATATETEATTDPQRTPAVAKREPRPRESNLSARQRLSRRSGRGARVPSPSPRTASALVRRQGPDSAPPVTLTGQVPESASTDQLISLLVLPNLQTNGRAVAALVEENDPETVEKLLSRLGSGNSPMDMAIVEALGHLGDLRAFPRCAALRNVENPRMRTTALASMAHLGGPLAAETLVEHLRKGPEEDRQVTLEVLALLPRPGVSSAVSEYLDGPDRQLRRVAATTLGKLRDRSAVAALEARLDDDDRYVRRAVVDALGKIGDPRCVASLSRVIGSDFDRGTRKTAVVALGEMGGRDNLPALSRIRDGDDSWLAGYARQAMEEIEKRHPRES